MTKTTEGLISPLGFQAAAFLLAAGLVLGLVARPAQAVPAFAVQTGQNCAACHVGGFGPELTPFGREFKLRGYTMRSGGYNAPVSVMAVASYVRTTKDQTSPPPHYSGNDNTTLDQASVFLAGGLGDHFGGFVQTTYDGVARAWHWDNLDLRAVTTVHLKGNDVLLGATVNNAPTVQDIWNTLPAWGYPYTSSALTPSGPASPLLNGAFAQTTLGASGYAWINSHIYVELGAYGSPGSVTLTRLGVDPTAPGNIKGLAPYQSLAYQTATLGGTAEVGLVGMQASIAPGLDASTGATDHYNDLGLDASFYRSLASGDTLSLNGRVLVERQRLNASYLLGAAARTQDRLTDLRMAASYAFKDGVGATVQYFSTTGTPDETLYAADRTSKPNTSGVMVQFDATPFGQGTSPLGPRFNMRVGVQYLAYFTFAGSANNYDAMGGKATDNSTLRVFTWFAY